MRRCSSSCQGECATPSGTCPCLSEGTPATALSKSACASCQSSSLTSCARSGSLVVIGIHNRNCPERGPSVRTGRSHDAVFAFCILHAFCTLHFAFQKFPLLRHRGP